MEVYILYSSKLQRHYVGFSKSASLRMKEHQRGKTHWTARAGDWQIVWKQDVDTIAEARALEKKIKARGAKRFLNDLGR